MNHIKYNSIEFTFWSIFILCDNINNYLTGNTTTEKVFIYISIISKNDNKIHQVKVHC